MFNFTDATAFSLDQTLAETLNRAGLSQAASTSGAHYLICKTSPEAPYYLLHNWPLFYLDALSNHPLRQPHMAKSLSMLNFCVSKFNTTIDHEIEKRLLENRSVKILEIGAGLGRVMIELASKYPELEIHGINKDRSEFDFGNKTKLNEVARFFKIKEPEDLSNLRAHYKDLSDGKLDPWKPESFDIIYSQAMLRFIERKDILLREIWRLLKPGGTAFINISLAYIHDNAGRPISVHDYFTQKLNRLQFDFCRTTSMLWVRKAALPLDLGLEYLKHASVRHEWDTLTKNSDLVGWHSHFQYKE